MTKVIKEKLVRWLIVNFPEPLKHDLKVQAAKEDISLKDLVIKICTQYLTKK